MQLVKGDSICVAVERDGLIVDVRVNGVLGAGRGGGLGAVAAGAVQRVPAAPGGVRMKCSQRQRQLLTGRTRLPGGRHGPGPLSWMTVHVVGRSQQAILCGHTPSAGRAQLIG